jgi:2-methylcitrate dehydratase
VVVEYLIGHPRRRDEGIPLPEEKFAKNLSRLFPPDRARTILELCTDQQRFERSPVGEFVDLLVLQPIAP